MRSARIKVRLKQTKLSPGRMLGECTRAFFFGWATDPKTNKFTWDSETSPKFLVQNTLFK